VEGFITLAPDALSPLGGYPEMMIGRELQRKRSREEML
jgi:carboxymethylenebutenolidase